MPWPHSQDYNEAIQNPATSFSDAELRQGHVVTNAQGLPMPCSGNFADVYQMRCPDGSRWAVKCFTRGEIGLRERYQEISAWLRKVKLPFTVDFSYLDKGIRVAGKWYPVLKMQWVEGLTLNQFVAQNLDKPAMLEALVQIWGKMAKYLRAAEVGHCDLQHGNVLLVRGTAGALALKLIDYDGMWVPPLTMVKSGEVGHPSYQHPQRLREGTYSIDVDRFPLLLVATALRALKAKGRALWEKYDNGDNILFKETDLLDPNQSALVQELLNLGDPATTTLLIPLLKSLRHGLESAPPLEVVLSGSQAACEPPRAPRPNSSAVPVASSSAVSSGGPLAAPATSHQELLKFDKSAQPASVASATVAQWATAKADAIPIWAWGTMIPVLIVGLAGLAWIFLILAAGNQLPATGPRVAGNRPSETPRLVEPRIVQKKVNLLDDPLVVSPPVVVMRPEELALAKPGAYVVRTYDWRFAGGVRSVGFSQHGNTAMALGADGVLTVFNPESPAIASSAALGYPVKCASLTPNGHRAVIAGADNKVHVRDLEEGKDISSLSGPIGSFTWQIMNSTKTITTTISRPPAINWVDVAPDGKEAILGSDGHIFFWDLEKGCATKGWYVSQNAISMVRFSPDGKSAVSCGKDGIARFWNVADGSETFKIENFSPDHPAKPVTAAFLPDNKVFVGFTAGAWALWNLGVGGMTTGGYTNGSEVNRTAVSSPDGRLVALSADRPPGLRIWDQKERIFYNVTVPIVSAECLGFAPDSRHVLVGCVDGSLHYVAITLPRVQATP